MYLTRLEVLINSLAIGVAVGAVAYLFEGPALAMWVGILAFVTAFGIFDFARRRSGPDE